MRVWNVSGKCWGELGQVRYKVWWEEIKKEALRKIGDCLVLTVPEKKKPYALRKQLSQRIRHYEQIEKTRFKLLWFSVQSLMQVVVEKKELAEAESANPTQK